MFDVEDFQEYPTLSNLILKFNKFQKKNKIIKVSKLIEELELLIKDQELVIPVTYILSIIAEHNINLISEGIIENIQTYLQSDNLKLKINSISILGFFILANTSYIDKYYFDFVKLLADKSQDIRDNGHFFLHEFIKEKPDKICSYINILLKALLLEDKNTNNIISLLNYLDYCPSLDFKQLYRFREISKNLISDYIDDKKSEIFLKTVVLIKKFYISLEEMDFKNAKFEILIKSLDDLFLMKKFNFSEVLKKKPVRLKDFINYFKRSRLKNKEIYFYIKLNEENILFFELEKEKLLNFFQKNNKISLEKLYDLFSPIVDKSEFKLLMNMLLKLGHIRGYLSKFYFYSYNYLKDDIINKFQQKGIVYLKNYNFLPPDFVYSIIDDLGKKSKEIYLLGKNKRSFYSFKSIIKQINTTAAKNSSIDLKAYRDRLLDVDFIKLIKNLPKEYLTNYHKGTFWLTNIGFTKIKTEIENSKLIGFFNMAKISERLNIKKILLMDVLELYVDLRSGIWDKSKDIFYYSKYITERIENVNIIDDEEEKEKKINFLVRELNIDKNIILTKIDENYQLIGEEIKVQDQIKISEYSEKLGMDNKSFMDFIGELGLNYLIKGDILIISPSRIADATKGIRSMLIEKSKDVDFITFGSFDINSTLVEELIRELEEDEKIKGIFYEDGKEILFYTERGISNLMLDNSMLFSFYDLFYGKELSEDEINLIKEKFNDLLKNKKLKGSFDEKTLTFSSDDVIFAGDYNKVVYDFTKKVNNYIKIFDREFQAIKVILVKRNEIIYPQEIKFIQEKIDKINITYVKWRSLLDAFIMNANNKLLMDQGYTLKRYQGLASDKKEEIKIFREDPDVYEALEAFNSWVKLFNELELNWGKLLFLQKTFINNPEDEETEKKIDELLTNLNLI